MWEVLFVEEFAEWLDGADADLRRRILDGVALLRQWGPQLGRPRVDGVKGSAYPNMKELRVSFRGEPWRVLFAFDPARAAVVLVAGNKAGDKRWYERNARIADERFRRHLEGG